MPVITISLVWASRSRIERRVFFDDLLQRAGELAFVAAALGRDGQADHGRGERDRRQRQVAQRRAGVQFFHLGHGHDAARLGRFDRPRFRWPGPGATGPIFTPLRAPTTGTVGRSCHRAGEDADETQLLHERVDAGLEDLGDQRAGGVGLDLDLFAGRVLAVRRKRVGRQAAQRQRVEQFGHAHARLARHADHRNQTPLGDGLERSAARLPRRWAACPRSSAP